MDVSTYRIGALGHGIGRASIRECRFTMCKKKSVLAGKGFPETVHILNVYQCSYHKLTLGNF